jgi:hypothetical protein
MPRSSTYAWRKRRLQILKRDADIDDPEAPTPERAPLRTRVCRGLRPARRGEDVAWKENLRGCRRVLGILFVVGFFIAVVVIAVMSGPSN